MTSDSQSSWQSLRRIWSFFDKDDRKRFVILFFFMLMNGLLELAGLAAIFPVISILTSDSWQQDWAVLVSIHQWLGISGRSNLAIFLMSALFVYFLFRNAFRVWVIWRSFRLTVVIQVGLINRLLKSVLGQNYAWFSQRNSSQHLQLIQDDAYALIIFLRSALILLAEAMSTIGIISLLLYSQPIVFILLIAFLALPAYIFQRSVRSYSRRVGERIRQLEVSTTTSLREVFGAIKEVKVAGSEGFTMRSYNKQINERNLLSSNFSVIQELPKIIMENAFLGGMVIVIALHIAFNDTVAGSLSYLGILAIAGFRAVPVTNKILVFLAQVKNIAASVQAISDQLRQKPVPEQTSKKQMFTPVNSLHFDAVSFGYHDSAESVLSDIDLRIGKGEMIGIVGVSGSGKTTLVDILLGLLMPQSGKVLVNDIDIAEDLNQWRQRTAYVPQSIFLVDRDIRSNVAFAVADHKIDDERVHQAIEAAQLSEFVAELPEGINTPVGESGVRLSGGQRQRLGIARALYRRPELLVLDEATSALDKATESRFMKTVEVMHYKCSMVIVAHRMTTIAHCDRVYSLVKGKLKQIDVPS